MLLTKLLDPRPSAEAGKLLAQLCLSHNGVKRGANNVEGAQKNVSKSAFAEKDSTEPALRNFSLV